jgi:hypothetical protein
MGDSSTTSILDQIEADEDILAYEVSDEALEAAAGTEKPVQVSYPYLPSYSPAFGCYC